MEKTEYAVKPPNPFNPGAAVDPDYFVGRVQELGSFREKLRQTIVGELASMSVAGGYGVGKTSFLHKCSRIAEEEGALTIYFSLNEVDNINKEGIARVLIERLRDKVEEEVILQKLTRSVSDRIKQIRIGASIGITSVGVEIAQNQQAYNPTLQAALKNAWQALENKKKAIVFLIDEAAVLEKNKAELMLYLRAVLEHLKLEKIPVMMMPAGKFSVSKSPIGAGFSPLVRTFPSATLYNFSEDESTSFINKKLNSVGMTISSGVCKRAYEASEGHPYVLNAYLNAAYAKLQTGEREIEKRHLEAVDVDFATVTLSQFFLRFYHGSGKEGRKILSKMAESKGGEILLSELTKLLGKGSYRLSPLLAKLVQDGAIYRIDRGKFTDPHTQEENKAIIWVGGVT